MQSAHRNCNYVCHLIHALNSLSPWQVMQNITVHSRVNFDVLIISMISMTVSTMLASAGLLNESIMTLNCRKTLPIGTSERRNSEISIWKLHPPLSATKPRLGAHTWQINALCNFQIFVTSKNAESKHNVKSYDHWQQIEIVWCVPGDWFMNLIDGIYG